MLISRVPEESGGEERGDAEHFQTANELFELMAKDHDFEATGEDPLTTRDLVLLYKNIDLGKQLMSNVHEFKRKTPNQYVETVIYQGQGERSSESDLSESLSNEDLDNIVQINKERIDMLTNGASNTLCHKLGDMEIQTSGFSAQYDRHFLFKDPYIKEQLINLKLMSTNELNATMLPASLLDYICCKRLEDNYNFYMDNIIRYVKNTIEQLKRISNGDYLTDKAKQKWKEVENDTHGGESKVLTTSTSIPLHVERKLTGLSSNWDDLVHSEVDLRSLAKILEKRIVLEVPKLISGSYKLFSNRRAGNLVVSCKRREPAVEERASRVDVVLKLQRSETGQVVSNIDSIMILQSDLLPVQKDSIEALPLTYYEPEKEAIVETPKIIELHEQQYDFEYNSPHPTPASDNNKSSFTDLRENFFEETDESCMMEYWNSDTGCRSDPRDDGDACVARVRRAAVSRIVRAEACVNLATPEDMNFTILSLNRETSLPDDNADSFYTRTKKKSPTRVRVKSPYENKSHFLEEKKRKKLLEVRERRERKKMAMNEGKVNKHKFCKSAIVPQASSSVTKLSITNKSFYNSIFGHNSNVDTVVVSNAKGRKGQKKDDMIPEMVQEEGEAGGEGDEPPPSGRSQKYINRSYYLDDAVTEMMYLQMQQNNDGVRTSASTSAVSTDSRANFSLSPSFGNLPTREVVPTECELLRPELEHGKPLTNSQSEISVVPTNTPKGPPPRRAEPAEVAAPDECRRSIDKIYLLMKKLGKIEPHDKPKTKHPVETVGSMCEPASAAPTDSGTSLKHQLTSSNPSYYSFEKRSGKDTSTSPPRIPNTLVEPKVIISTKQREKPDAEKPAKAQKRVTLSPRVRPYPDNPLKAISQLLHEFDNVQKTRQKSVVDLKKKEAAPADGRSSRDACKRRPRVEQPPAHVRDKPERAKTVSPRVRGGVGEGPRPQGAERRRLAELIEEAAEARGEAVRGPAPALSSRLNALAQPKRPHAPPHAEPLGARHPRAQVPERPYRQAAPKPRPRPRRGAEPAAPKPTPPPLVMQSAERAGPGAGGARARRSASSPERRAAEPRAPPAAPHALKKKMVSVESYVNLHFGRDANAARAPVLPSDLELSSMSTMSSPMPDESAAIGSKLHRMISSMCGARGGLAERGDGAPPVRHHPPTFDISLPTRPRPTPTFDISLPTRPRPTPTFDISLPTHPRPASPHSDPPSPHSDHLATLPSRGELEPAENPSDLKMFSSITQLEMLESALYRKMSLGAFPKRLRIKNLTLTPKHSVQRIVVLQAGDATSLLLNSKLSQNFINATKSTSNEIGLPLSTTHLNWRFSQLPMQISTVGYAFPSYERESRLSSIKLENDCNDTDVVTDKVSSGIDSDEGSNDTNDCIKENECCQCFEGSPPRPPGSECAVQANDTDFASASSNNPITISKSNAETNTNDDLKKEKPIERHSAEAKEATDQDMDILRAVEGDESEILDYTTSLDILVGLLNEIQKITTCASEGLDDSKGDGAPASTPDGPDKLPQQLKTSSSLISLYASKDAAVLSTSTKSSDTKSVTTDTVTPAGGSKEAAAQFPEAQHVAVLTELPRLHLASEMSATRSLMEAVLRGPATSRSMVAFTDYHALFSEPSSDGTSNVMRLREIGTNPGSVKSLVTFHDNVVKDVNKDVAVTCKALVKNAVRREKCTSGDALVNTVEVIRSPQRKGNLNKCCLNAADFDPMIRVKRDILVTVYSFLVLTVFAALSFPEMMLHHS